MSKRFALTGKVLAVLLSLSCSIGPAAADEIGKAFQAIVDTSAPGEEKQAALEKFSRRYGVTALDTLSGQAAAHPGSEAGRLALEAIGMIGGAPAVDTLKQLIARHRSRDAQLMIFTLAEITDGEAVAQLRQISLHPEPLTHRLAAITAMRWRGDADDVQRLKTAAATTKDPRIRPHLLLAAESIQDRLTRRPGDMTPEQWGAYQRQFWPLVVLPPQLRSMEAAYREAAVQIQKKGALPAVFLKRVMDRELEPARVVAVELMGLQKQTVAVDTFYQLAQGKDLVARAGLNALVQVGNARAVELLSKLLEQENFDWPTDAVEGLVTIGTPQAATALEEVAEKTAREDLAGYCRRAAVRIRKKL
jgi:HEAT repeat protein